MPKFVNHVDHVAWISRPESLEANVERLQQLSGAVLTPFGREDMGFAMYIELEAGHEIVAPLEKRTEFNQTLYDWLDKRGEGIFSVVFGIKDLEAHRRRDEALGFSCGPEMHDDPASPCHHQLPRYDSRIVNAESDPASFMNTCFILGDIDYAEGVVSFQATPATNNQHG